MEVNALEKIGWRKFTDNFYVKDNTYIAIGFLGVNNSIAKIKNDELVPFTKEEILAIAALDFDKEESEKLAVKQSLFYLEKHFETFITNLLLGYRTILTEDEWRSVQVIRHNLYRAFVGIGEEQYKTLLDESTKVLKGEK